MEIFYCTLSCIESQALTCPKYCVVVLLGFRKMQLKLPKCDCVVEVHDARISFILIPNCHSGVRPLHLHFHLIIFPLYLKLSFSLHISLLHTKHTHAPADNVNQDWSQGQVLYRRYAKFLKHSLETFKTHLKILRLTKFNLAWKDHSQRLFAAILSKLMTSFSQLTSLSMQRLTQTFWHGKTFLSPMELSVDCKFSSPLNMTPLQVYFSFKKCCSSKVYHGTIPNSFKGTFICLPIIVLQFQKTPLQFNSPCEYHCYQRYSYVFLNWDTNSLYWKKPQVSK